MLSPCIWCVVHYVVPSGIFQIRGTRVFSTWWEFDARSSCQHRQTEDEGVRGLSPTECLRGRVPFSVTAKPTGVCSPGRSMLSCLCSSPGGLHGGRPESSLQVSFCESPMVSCPSPLGICNSTPHTDIPLLSSPFHHIGRENDNMHFILWNCAFKKQILAGPVWLSG